MFWNKSSNKENKINNENSGKNETKINKIENSTSTTNSNVLVLPCDHYDFEFNACKSFKTKIYNYYRGETTEHECDYYKNLFLDCTMYEREPARNFNSLLRLKAYENDLAKKRIEENKTNDVWTMREVPPSDWNSPLPDWCNAHLKTTYWYKNKSSLN
jgi:hypothetical protein